MRAALIDIDGLVVNVIEIPDAGLPDGWAPDGLIVHVLDDEPVGPGWTLDGDTFVPPAPPAPPEPGPVEQLQVELDATNAVLAGVLNLLGTFQGGA